MFSQLFVESPADVLRGVTGLVIAQHAGGGKSDQYLIRGFDADHGTDVQMSVDGVPVNMVSHAHGQGYADLHFLIPETIEHIDVHKGPYYAEFGNLATAGAVQLVTRDRFDRSFVRMQAGSFGTGRVVFGLSPVAAPAWLAGEALMTDGPFRNPQDFTRLNVAAKWRKPIGSAQDVTVPVRPTAGGGTLLDRSRHGWSMPAFWIDSMPSIRPRAATRRAHAAVLYNRSLGRSRLTAQTYLLRYSLDLFSNFTFFARDARAGDGILQRDRRTVWGGRVQSVTPHTLGPVRAVATVGSEWRRDAIDVGLFHQQQRRPFDTVVDSAVAERDLGLYLQEDILFNEHVREARWRLASPLWAEVDVTASRGRYRETDALIARAPRLTLNAAVVLADWRDWSGQLRVRHVADHPAVEDGSVDASGFIVTDLHVRRRVSADWDALVSVENLFNSSYREAQTFFPSRLANEPMAVDDIHFTPGNPRAIRIGFEYRFDFR
jgi:hypothetical protein